MACIAPKKWKYPVDLICQLNIIVAVCNCNAFRQYTVLDHQKARQQRDKEWKSNRVNNFWHCLGKWQAIYTGWNRVQFCTISILGTTGSRHEGFIALGSSMPNVTRSNSTEKQGKVRELPSGALPPFGAFNGFMHSMIVAWHKCAMVVVACRVCHRHKQPR